MKKIISNALKNDETRFENNKKLEKEIKKLNVEYKEHKRNVNHWIKLIDNLIEEFNNPRRVKGHHDERSRNYHKDDRRDNYRQGK